jgi:membrane-associated phospholipid phosphatase
MALATGYFRVAADRHWATDVISGWVMGTIIGAGVPWLFHRPCPVVPAVGRAGDATTVGVALAWWRGATGPRRRRRRT